MYEQTSLGHLDYSGRFLPKSLAKEEISKIDKNIKGIVVVYNLNESTTPPDMIAVKVVGGNIVDKLTRLLNDECVRLYLPNFFGYRPYKDGEENSNIIDEVTLELNAKCK